MFTGNATFLSIKLIHLNLRISQSHESSGWWRHVVSLSGTKTTGNVAKTVTIIKHTILRFP